VYAATSLNNGGGTPQPDVADGTMQASHQRALCWRVIMPDSTATTETQNVQVVVTAQ